MWATKMFPWTNRHRGQEHNWCVIMVVTVTLSCILSFLIISVGVLPALPDLSGCFRINKVRI